jgi:hypothetical protein
LLQRLQLWLLWVGRAHSVSTGERPRASHTSTITLITATISAVTISAAATASRTAANTTTVTAHELVDHSPQNQVTQMSKRGCPRALGPPKLQHLIEQKKNLLRQVFLHELNAPQLETLSQQGHRLPRNTTPGLL